MKSLTKIFALGAALVAAAPFASATPINATVNVAGSSSFNTTTISFPAGQQSTTGGSSLNGTVINYGTAVTFVSPLTFSPGVNLSTGVMVAQIASLGLNFFVLTETPVYTADNGKGYTTIDLKGTGYFTEGGFTQTPATFDLTAQELIGSSAGTITSFSASSNTVNAVTPEPSSLVLLGSGLVSAAGMMIRRRRIA